MGVRRDARESALKLLYGLEFGHSSPADARKYFWENHEGTDEVQGFTQRLVEGVLANRDAIDAEIEGASMNWRLDRMAIVDRNILRIATYELRHCEDIPDRVSLNEAIEVGKRYGAEDSGAFINGILDRIIHTAEQS